MEVALSRLWAPADQTMTYPLNIVTQIESSERKIRLFLYSVHVLMELSSWTQDSALQFGSNQ